MSIKAVFTDLDGTLLNENHRISEYTSSVLKRLRSCGVYFIVCTGRPYGDVFGTIADCGLDPDFIVTSNGGRVHNRQREVVLERDLDPELVRRLINIRTLPNAEGDIVPAVDGEEAAGKTFVTTLHRHADVVTDKSLPEVVSAYHDGVVTVDCGKDLYTLPDEQLRGVHYMWFLGQPSDLERVQKHLRKYYSDEVTSTFSLPYSIDAVPVGVNKGVALQHVAGLLNIPLEQVACFGDGMNDESMLRITGHPFIMSNAQDALKTAIPHGEVIGTNTEDGVAKKLVELFSL